MSPARAGPERLPWPFVLQRRCAAARVAGYRTCPAKLCVLAQFVADKNKSLGLQVERNLVSSACMNSCLAESDLQDLGNEMLASFERRVAAIPSDLCAPF